MTDPSEDELRRAERVKRLRAGDADGRGRRRQPAVPDDPAATPAGPDGDEAIAPDAGHDEPVDAAAQELPDDAPADLTVAAMYLTEDLKGKTERIEEHLQLRYEVEFDTPVDGPRHVRPLALYLGLRQLEKLELDDVRGLFAQVDTVESPVAPDDDG